MAFVPSNLEDVLYQVHEAEGPYFLRAEATVFGVSFHVNLILLDPERCSPPDDAPIAALQLFQSMQHFYRGDYELISVPGRPGKYVMFVFPFCQ